MSQLRLWIWAWEETKLLSPPTLLCLCHHSWLSLCPDKDQLSLFHAHEAGPFTPSQPGPALLCCPGEVRPALPSAASSEHPHVLCLTISPSMDPMRTSGLRPATTPRCISLPQTYPVTCYHWAWGASPVVFPQLLLAHVSRCLTSPERWLCSPPPPRPDFPNAPWNYTAFHFYNKLPVI